MQVLQAGQHKLLRLELEKETVLEVARQAGFAPEVREDERRLVLDLEMPNRHVPLLLFDAADPGNLGWFSRCHFYVEARSGAVMQTPIILANQRDGAGRVQSTSVRVQIAKELPADFRLPGKQPVTEQMVYAVLFNFLSALVNVGVGVCGQGVVKPLAGRTEIVGNRN
ncbi:MAG: hypothetical protein K2X03_31360 [Bryobacteraceae bacterium]|nr:hypothetical protein [Bryobacteraceae bacterium]